MCEINRWKMGDLLAIPGSEKFILARTINFKEPDLHHFQFIGIVSGNRLSNNVVTVREGIDDVVSLRAGEVEYLYDDSFHVEFKDIEQYHIRQQ